MNSNKFITILGLFLLLILAIGSISASDVDSDLIGDNSASIDLTSTEKLVNEIDDSNIVDNVNARDIIANNGEDEKISADIDSVLDVEKSEGVKESLGASPETNAIASTVKFTESKYSTYFNGSGDIISGKLKAGDTLDFSGTFNSKSFIINIPLTITSTDGSANLNDCYFSFISGSDGSNISNLKAKQVSTAQRPIFEAIGVSNLTFSKNDLFSNQTGSHPMTFNGVSKLRILNNRLQCNAYTNTSGWGQPSVMVFRSSGNCNISGNTVITNDSNGIYFTGYGADSSMGTTPEDSSYGNYIFNNTIYSVRELPSSFCYAIQLMCKDNIVLNNTIYNTFRGISTTSSGNQIIGNKIYNIHGAYYSQATEEEGADYAIYTVSNSVVKENIIYDCNFKNDSKGAAIYVAKNSIVSDNVVRNCTGLGVNVAGSNVNITDNNIDVSGYGVYIKGNISDINIESNIIDSKACESIYLEKQSRSIFPHDITIQGNTLYSGGIDAIHKDDVCTNIVESNNIIKVSHRINENNFYEYFSNTGSFKNKIKENDTIIFMGNFSSKGKLYINEKVTIKGVNAIFKDTTFIVSENDGVVIENIAIVNPNTGLADRLWGIQISKSNNVTIKNCNISIYDPYSAFAIYVLDSNDCKIIGNSLEAKGDYFTVALFSFNSTNILIDGNSIKTIGSGETYLCNNRSCLNILVKGVTICADGTIVCPDGTTYSPDDYEICADGTIICPDGTQICADGTTICADGTQICADGTIICADGTQICADGTIICADGTQICADGTIICPDGTQYAPDEYTTCADGTILCPDGTTICVDGSGGSGILDGVIPNTHMISGLFRTYGALFVHSSNVNFKNNIVSVSSNLDAFYKLNESCNTIAGVFIHYGGFNNTISNNNISLVSNDPVIYGIGIVGASSNSTAVGSKNNSFIKNNVFVKGPYHGVGIYLGYKAINSTFANNFDISALNPYEIVNRTLVENDKNIIGGNKFKITTAHNTALTVSNSSFKWNNANKTITIALKDINGTAISNKAIVLSLNGINYTAQTNANGIATVKVSISKVGAYDMIAYFNGDGIYIASTNQGELTLTKDKTSLTSSGKTYTVTTSSKAVKATLKDGRGNVIKNRKVKATVNGKTYTATTNSKGVATFKLTLKAVKTYNVSLKFAGDTYYTASTKSIKVKVTKTKTKLTVPKKTYKAKAKVKKLTATLKDQTGKVIKSKKITFIVNKKKYTAKTNKKGVATVKVKLSKKKTYKFTVKFAGDKTYVAVKKTGKVVIK
ncbi:MAG: right-handed parallel beta-helix repeat-containing protein [Methanobrevibacter sp.]|nr:right-handed parallel beta-helix repeat-containing protein [Methanobrevibacter sp.]